MNDRGGTPSPPTRRVRAAGRAPTLVDAAVAVTYTAILLASPAPTDVPTWVRLLVAALAGLPLAARRHRPLAVLVVVSLASVVGLVTGVISDPLLGVAFAVYPVAIATPDLTREPTRILGGIAALVVAVAALGGTADPQALADDVRRVILALVVIAGAWTLGRLVRERRRQAAAAWQEAADRLVLEERVRLARDLHDLVSGSLSMIGVRAAVALHLADERPDQLREALQVIDAAAADGLTEMRRMLAVLRGEDAPLPPLEDALEAEIARAAAGGVRLDVDVAPLPDLPPQTRTVLGLAVREAVTNLLRHAAPTTGTLHLTANADRVDLRVRDDGPSAGHVPVGASAGVGLRGMQERVTRVGGTMTAGPHGAGWEVAVSLPLEGRRQPAGEVSDRADHRR